MILAAAFLALQNPSAGSMAVRGGKISYECESAVVLDTASGKEKFVSNMQNALRFKLVDFNDVTRTASLEDTFFRKTPLEMLFEIEGVYRTTAFTISEPSSGKALDIILVLNMQDPTSPAFLQKFTMRTPGSQAPRVVTRSGNCRGNVEFERHP